VTAELRLTFPAREAEIRGLRVGDVVTVDGEVIGIRDRTHVRLVDEGEAPPFDLAGALLFHTAPNVRRLDSGAFELLSLGPTTSARMARFTEAVGRDHGVRAICGKGGLPDEAIEPLCRHGMVYLAHVGGAAALATEQVEEIEAVAWEDLMPECLWRFRVRGFGPLTVAIDSHGNSLYRDVSHHARAKLEELYARL
jgi:L(+)-tartrate dehydratase beta subunit